VKAIAAGGYHSMALKNDGTIVAWGDNSRGQTDIPPVARQGIQAIAGGLLYSLALTQTGSVIAWGSNRYGQTTVPPGALQNVTAIAAGDYYAVALKNDGSVISWGDDSLGVTEVPEQARQGVGTIAAGHYNTAVIFSSTFTLNAVPMGQSIRISWPGSISGIHLQASDAPTPGTGWIDITNQPTIMGGNNVIDLPLTGIHRWFQAR
jgi:alpha-tubulin suppressor-like RCC1 family protein